MAHDYKTVTWTPFKKRFDLVLLTAVLLYLAVFVTASSLAQPEGESLHIVQLLIAATGTLAFGMLTFILSIGPLARFTGRMKPVLYNRRHLGVTTFFLALIHAGLVVMWYHGFSETNVFVSLLASNPRYDSLQGFPFESLGVAAFFILLVMAATSHDFFNANLGPGLWKSLHMSVYVAYALLVGHVMLGYVQSQTDPAYGWMVAGGAAWLSVLHLGAAFKSASSVTEETDGWLAAGKAADFAEAKARIVTPPYGEKIAVFLHEGRLSAVSHVCRHQGGPLGEGKVVDGCITCPWHGFQYRLEDGRSPEPFTERIATYRLKAESGTVYVHPEPNEPGSYQEPLSLREAGAL
ncbi:ferric reductase-like transmembrane domain-containing protein [Parvularcula maris]|uniref:Ferric reductase-like transmembrane domain-containing protein n=1 Tax=Parvularcula maris TaxID=2965077 RepID=A0A9X2LCN5_9PROT|nr:ferric reductase-like transmembrane domain-containing protein [Parvularcula maris]MCQ8186067.1 ferric reductase-like transmembrane domain-containing protein [Parvularcula maris]